METLAQWIRLWLPFSGPGFESQAHHQRFYSQILYCICHCIVKRTKINKKRLLGQNKYLFKYGDLLRQSSIHVGLKSEVMPQIILLSCLEFAETVKLV